MTRDELVAACERAQLSDVEVDAVVARYFLDRPVDAIAADAGVTPRAIRYRLASAHRKIGAELDLEATA